MKLKNSVQVEAFMEAVNKCEGNVFLRSLQGDIFNMKSALSQYIAMGALLGQHGDDLELFAEKKEDEHILLEFEAKLYHGKI